MNEGQATLKDIAEILGISISTVSRALKDHPDVNAATKKKVLELAKKLDYEPNMLALNLLKKHLIKSIQIVYITHSLMLPTVAIGSVLKKFFHFTIIKSSSSKAKLIALQGF